MVSPGLPKKRVLLPRSRYRLVLSLFPGLKRSERLKAIEFRLPQIYPGPMEDIHWESRLLPGPSGAVLSALVSRGEIDEIIQAHPESRIYIPIFHCIDLGFPRRGQTLELEYPACCTDKLIRNTADEFSFSSQPNIRQNQNKPETEGHNWRVISPRIPGLHKKTGRTAYRGAFTSEHHGQLTGGFRAVLLVMALLSGLLVYGERLLNAREAELLALSRITRSETRRINAAAELEAEIKELEALVLETETQAHIDPWRFLNSLAPLMPPGTRIRSFSARGDSFTLELSSRDIQDSALALGEALSRRSDFSDIIFQDVRIAQESPEGPHISRYRLTGRFNASDSNAQSSPQTSIQARAQEKEYR